MQGRTTTIRPKQARPLSADLRFLPSLQAVKGAMLEPRSQGQKHSSARTDCMVEGIRAREMKESRVKMHKPLAKSRATDKFIREGAKKHKRFYQELGLAEDPNKVIGKKKKNYKKNNQQPSAFVRELEEQASKPLKKKFKFSKVMCGELEYYINKYSDDYEAMARDKKNIYQDSPGQLRYKIKKYLKIHCAKAD